MLAQCTCDFVQESLLLSAAFDKSNLLRAVGNFPLRIQFASYALEDFLGRSAPTDPANAEATRTRLDPHGAAWSEPKDSVTKLRVTHTRHWAQGLAKSNE